MWIEFLFRVSSLNSSLINTGFFCCALYIQNASWNSYRFYDSLLRVFFLYLPKFVDNKKLGVVSLLFWRKRGIKKTFQRTGYGHSRIARKTSRTKMKGNYTYWGLRTEAEGLQGFRLRDSNRRIFRQTCDSNFDESEIRTTWQVFSPCSESRGYRRYYLTIINHCVWSTVLNIKREKQIENENFRISWHCLIKDMA